MPRIYFCNQSNNSETSFQVNQISKCQSIKSTNPSVTSALEFVLVDNENSGINLFDRGLNYGDGTFTTMLLEPQLGIYLYDEHIERLTRSLKTLAIRLDMQLLKDVIKSICQKEFVSNTVNSQFILKVLITRGTGGRGYMPPDQVEPNVIITLSQTSTSYLQHPSIEHAITMGIARTKLAQQPLLAGLKHTNRLEQVLAKLELKDMHVDDLLLTCQNNYLIEATSSNVFFTKEGRWFTPKLTQCGVIGVMRNAIIEHLSQNGVSVNEIDISIEELSNYNSMFLCNALNPIIPVKSVSTKSSNKPLLYAIEPVAELFLSFIPFLKKRTTIAW